MTADLWTRLLSIIVIDLTLAGDNALVIAMAVRSLPRNRRLWARVLGTGGAIGLRLLFITVATYLLRIPLLQAAGGLVLAWIAIKLVLQESGQGHDVKNAASMPQAIWVILVADAVMSLDNVLAVAGAAGGELLLVVIGIGLSLPLVVWGSGILAALMDRVAWIIWLGGGILGYVSGDMILADAAVVGWLGDVRPTGLVPAVPLALAALMMALGWWAARARQSGAAPKQV